MSGSDIGRVTPVDRQRESRTLAANRRHHHRILWEHHDLEPILLEAEAPGEDWRHLPCTLVDVGPGGVGVLVEQPLEPGSLVRVTFALPPHPEEAELLEPVPWSGTGQVVHTRHTPARVHNHVPHEAHRPHHHGVRFGGLDFEAEARLLRALYGPMPAGWAVERYQIQPSIAGRDAPPGNSDAARVGAATVQHAERTRYAVVRDGNRIARGFTTYDRARTRAWSLHMDTLAEHARRSL